MTATRSDGDSRRSGGGPRVLVVGHEDHAGLGRLEPVLRAGLKGGSDGSLDLRRPDLGDPLPRTLAGYHGLVVLGGSMGAADDDIAAWLPLTRRLLAEGVERQLPTVGICLGAQLLAAATGGRVERGAAGLEVGLVEIELLPAAADDVLLGPVLTAAGPRVAVPQWHQDAVTELPAGAVPLAAGARYPHQAFRLGGCAWGLQYHPEVTGEDFDDWLAGGHGAIRTAGLHPGDVRAALLAAEQAQRLLARVHAVAFADLVTAVVAGRPAG
jgi:GMP synthase-like glutamine amidotransferase